VLEKIGKVAYKLLLPNGCLLHPVFHVSQLKKHLGPLVIPTPDLPLVDKNGNIKVAPETILERRLIPRNNEPVVQWLIKWINLSVQEATWEDADFIRRIFPSLRTRISRGGGHCQATTRLAFPLFSFVRVMQMEVLQRSRR